MAFTYDIYAARNIVLNDKALEISWTPFMRLLGWNDWEKIRINWIQFIRGLQALVVYPLEN